MPLNLLLLGQVPVVRDFVWWVAMQMAMKARPHFEMFLQDPGRTISRLGDVLVWNGENGRHVIGTLEGLADSQGRIEQAVGRIETAQIAAASNLSALTSLSIATLGVTSLAAGYMIWRMEALHKRLNMISQQIADIQVRLDATIQAHLETGLASLQRFEKSQLESDHQRALDESNVAKLIYRSLVQAEIAGPRRLPALNQCGRYYLLSLTAEARCLILSKDLELAQERLADESSVLASLSGTVFKETMGKSPELYFHPNLQADHVTLVLLAEVYRQARQVGAIGGDESRDAGHLFEQLRAKIYGAEECTFPLMGKAKATLLSNLKYLMACLEEVARVEALRLRIVEAQAGRLSFEELEKSVRNVMSRRDQVEPQTAEAPIFAFAFA